MASMTERMNDANFYIKTPLCLLCRNRKDRKFNPQDVEASIFICNELGEVPLDLYHCKRQNCGFFVPEWGEVEQSMQILTQEQLDYINQFRKDA